MDMEGLSAICAGLGVVEEDEDGNRIGYSKAEYCLDNLKDLLRFLRRDDPQNRDVFKQVCRWNTVSKDLIPIIEHCEDDRNLVLNAVKVLVFLTMPIEPSSSDISQQIEYLWGLKSSITCSGIVAITVSLLENPLENLEADAMTEDDWKLVQLILTLFKNLLAIQEISLQQKAGGTASHFLSLRDRFLELLFQENVMELIIVISQHFGGFLRQDNLLLLDIFHYIFLGQEPELVAKAHLKSSKADEGSKASINSLKSLMEEEDAKRRLFRTRNVVRHSHFVGTFTRLTMDGSKELINGKPSSISRNAPIKQHKVSRGPAKTIAWDHGGLPPSKDNILELLHDFVNQFLSGGYNGLMQSLREDIEKEHSSIQESDVIVFFQVAQFVTSFQYHKFFASKLKREADVSKPVDDMQSENTSVKGDVCAPIAATMKDTMFQLVFSNWREKFEGLKETQNFKFISVAGSLMKNMIRMLDLVLNEFPEDSKESQTARILLYKLFYDQTDQGLTQFLLNMIKSFDTHKQTKSDMEDLVEMICKILHLMENLQSRGTLRVAKKTRRGKKKKTPVEKEAKSNLVGEQSSVQNEIDSSNTDKPAEVDTAPEEAPVEKDANSDHSGEPPSVRNETGSSNTDKPVEVDSAPKETENTSSDETRETETDAPADNPEEPVLEMDTDPLLEKDHKNSGDANTKDDLDGAGESSDDEQVPETSEVDFNVTTLVSSLANNSIIQNTCWLLKFYKSNTTNTNDYIIGILRRVCDDLELSPMLYQLSLLTSFYDILAQQKSSPCKEYANIVDFLKRLVRKMFKKMKSQPLLFVEALFWKTRKECHYINAEYLVHELGHYRKDLKNRRKDSEDQGVSSSPAREWRRVSIADALGDDEADVEIAHDLGNDSDVNVREVKGSTSFISDGDDGEENNLNGHKPKRVPREPRKAAKMKKIPLGPDMDEKIRDLYEKLKDSQDCSCLIAEDLDPDGRVSSLQVSNKLKQLGLISGPRKRIRHVGDSTAFNPDKLEDGNDPEKGSLSQSKKARKRVHAFSDDQEATIRDLYEQFKDHKRCSFMIANAMEGDTKFSSAQVSRKLKQLGLYIPRQKRPKTSNHLMDEDLKGNSTDKENESDSDDEPLSSLVHRGRKRENGLFTEDIQQKNSAKNISEDDSDNETLASVAKGRKREHDELFSEDIRQKSSAKNISEDNSDNETLASVAKGRKKENERLLFGEDIWQKSSAKNISEDDSDNETLASVAKGRKRENDGLLFGEDIRQKSSAKNISEDDSDNETLVSVAKKRKRSLSKSKDQKLTKISNYSLEIPAKEGIQDGDVGGQSSISEPAEIASAKESTEAEEDLVLGKKSLDGTPPMSPNISLPRDVESDDLEDSEDEEAGHSEPSTASVVNRRRMVVDFEDDDD